MQSISPFATWQSFYVIVGSAAAALTGLQFVVIVLGAQLNHGGSMSATRAFGTPTVLHFSAALLISAIASSPWPELSFAWIALAATGIVGVAYDLRVLRHALRQSDYAPDLEDWTWHNVLPLIAHTALVAAAVMIRRDAEPALFVVGGAALLLLFIGIHNAWDAVTFMAVRRRTDER